MVDDITVQVGSELMIHPGAVFQHSGHFSWNIYGKLVAKGTLEDSIGFVLQEQTKDHRWGGIRFHSGASEKSKIDY